MDKVIYHIAPKRSGHAFVGNMIKSWFDGTLFYFDKENTYPKLFKPDPQTCIIVLQTRDLLNWYASYFKSVSTPGNKVVEYWWQITREIYYPEYFRKFNTVEIIYDDFFVSRAYRKAICELLGGEYNETELNRITMNGGGSSFTRDQYDGEAQRMNTLNRYRQVNPSIYRTLFNRKSGLLDFYKKICSDADKLKFVNTL